MADVRRWGWLTGHRNSPTPDPRQGHPDHPALDGTAVLTEMLERCERTAALLSGSQDSAVMVDPGEVTRSLGEMATMLVAAGAELEQEVEAGTTTADVGILAARLMWLGRRCQRRAHPFTAGYADSEDRDEAWRALQDVQELLQELLKDPRAASGGAPA
jgi:hypothetical protein